MAFRMSSKNKALYSTYHRVKNNCCEEWKVSKIFYEWYWRTEREQESLCKYCKLPGNTIKYYG
jgi:hypothetical protein